MKDRISIIVGKIIQFVSRLRGGGSALPGLVVEKINPNFIGNMLGNLKHGVVVVSGTNGKTTTTKMVVELLESQGMKVFSNKTGSNFVRGVGAALLSESSWTGKLNADIAVLELDEAHATHFVKLVKPRYSLLLNVMRDQLDRFGEIDYTAELLKKIGENTTKSVVLNANDTLLGKKAFSKDFSNVVKFGFDQKLAEFFPNDDEMHSENIKKAHQKISADVLLKGFSEDSADIVWGGKVKRFNLKISGIHNILNLTAAIALVDEILKSENIKINKTKIISAAGKILPAFGRGEKIKIKGRTIEIMLVKNPAGFRINLKNFNPENYSTMIAINDNYADGRDMSWLWDVDFSVLKDVGVQEITGSRAYDMAIRLFHDTVPFEEENIDTDIHEAVKKFVADKSKNKRIYATYTAMLEIRKELSKMAEMEKIL